MEGVDKEKGQEALKRGVLYGFVPHRLYLEGKDELRVFPFNIMFQRFRTEDDGSHTSGTALYDPDLSTLRFSEHGMSMMYRDQYGGDSHVTITIDVQKWSYSGEKFVNGVCIGIADGRVNGLEDEKGWQLFFIHLTMLGLSPGEQCKFTPIKV